MVAAATLPANWDNLFELSMLTGVVAMVRVGYAMATPGAAEPGSRTRGPEY